MSIPLWIKLSGQKIIHVFYHTVSDAYLPHINPLYKPKTVKEFKSDIEFMLKHFVPVTVNDVLRHVTKEKQIGNQSFHISFDDGLSEIYHLIAPILYQKGIPATVFVNSNFVNNKDLFYRYKAAVLADKIYNSGISSAQASQIQNIFRDSHAGSIDLSKISGDIKDKLLQVTYFQKTILDDIAHVLDVDFNLFLKSQRPYLTVDELKELQSKGFTIGAHSIDHPHYGLLNQDEQIRQTAESIKFVQQHLSEKNRYFAFPFSDSNINPAFFASLNSIVDISFGISGINTEHNGKHIQRIEMERINPSAKKRIKYCYMINFLKHRF